MHMIKFKDIWEQKLFPLLIGRGWKYRRGGENIVTIFSPRGEDIVGVKISSHTGSKIQEELFKHDVETYHRWSKLWCHTRAWGNNDSAKYHIQFSWLRYAVNSNHYFDLNKLVNSSPPSAAYASENRVSIGSDDCLSPIRHRAII